MIHMTSTYQIHEPHKHRNTHTTWMADTKSVETNVYVLNKIAKAIQWNLLPFYLFLVELSLGRCRCYLVTLCTRTLAQNLKVFLAYAWLQLRFFCAFSSRHPSLSLFRFPHILGDYNAPNIIDLWLAIVQQQHTVLPLPPPPPPPPSPLPSPTSPSSSFSVFGHSLVHSVARVPRMKWATTYPISRAYRKLVLLVLLLYKTCMCIMFTILSTLCVRMHVLWAMVLRGCCIRAGCYARVVYYAPVCFYSFLLLLLLLLLMPSLILFCLFFQSCLFSFYFDYFYLYRFVREFCCFAHCARYMHT